MPELWQLEQHIYNTHVLTEAGLRTVSGRFADNTRLIMMALGWLLFQPRNAISHAACSCTCLDEVQNHYSFGRRNGSAVPAILENRLD